MNDKWEIVLETDAPDLRSVSGINEYVHPFLEEDIEHELLCLIEEAETEMFAELAEIHRLSTEIHGTISKVHNSLVGHHGVDRTLKNLLS
jgi:hypothetical protein